MTWYHVTRSASMSSHGQLAGPAGMGSGQWQHVWTVHEMLPNAQGGPQTCDLCQGVGGAKCFGCGATGRMEVCAACMQPASTHTSGSQYRIRTHHPNDTTPVVREQVLPELCRRAATALPNEYAAWTACLAQSQMLQPYCMEVAGYHQGRLHP